MRSDVVDIDARTQHRVIFAHRIYHNLARFGADSCNIIEIALDNDGIVYRENELCVGTSEVLVNTNHRFAEDDTSARLNWGINMLIVGFVPA